MLSVVLYFFGLFFTPANEATITAAEVEIDGLTCSLCQYGVERSLKKLPFVSSVKVDLNSNIASVTFKSESIVTLRDVINSVKKAGFSVRSLTATLEFTNEPTGNFFVVDGATFFILKSPENKFFAGSRKLHFAEKSFTDASLYLANRKLIDDKLKMGTKRDWIYFVTL